MQYVCACTTSLQSRFLHSCKFSVWTCGGKRLIHVGCTPEVHIFLVKENEKINKKCTKWSSTGFIVMQNMFIEILIPKIQHLKYISSLLATKAAA